MLYKLIVNITSYFKMKYFFKCYQSWLFVNRDSKLLSYKSSVIKLFERAGIKDCYLPYVRNMGYGQLASYSASVMQAFPSPFEDFASVTYSLFQDAIGIYRSRIFETFSPIYWINLIIFLPKNLFNYLGVKSESIIIKILQCIWWFITPVLLLFREKIINHLIPFF